ncbi:MAG: hypothetical protein ACXVK3_11950, partial [Candidatus Angelobacter sp.]
MAILAIGRFVVTINMELLLIDPMRKFLTALLPALILFLLSSGFSQDTLQSPTPPPAAPASTQQPQPAAASPTPAAQPQSAPSRNRVEVEPIEKIHQITPAEAKELFRSVDEILHFASKDTGLPIRKKVKRTIVSRAQVEK